MKCSKKIPIFIFISLLSYLSLLRSAVCQETNSEGSLKTKIAIMEPKILVSVNKAFNSKELLSILETSLNATRKFDIVSRDKAKLKVLREEQEFSKSEFSAGNAAFTGHLKAANFIVFPSITSFSFGRTSRPMPNIDNKYFINDSGNLSIDIQVVDSTTGEIKGTFPVSSSFGSKESIVNSKGGGPAQSNFTKLCKEVGEKFATQLINTIYPTRVLKVTRSDIWINRGANSGISIGQQFKVYRPGEALIDPDTGENLGSTEEEVGTIKINRINPKVAVGNTTKEEMLENIREGDLVRPDTK